MTQLRRPIGATLEERRSRERVRVDVVAIAPDAVRFVAQRSLPPGTECTLALRRVPPVEVEITVRSTASFERDLFACSAVVRRVRASDRERYAQLVRARAARTE
jgi:hypothetical protein